MSRTLYGDTLVRLRRRRELGLAAELQWGLLPPLTFACTEVTVPGALEPAYEVAGDSLDYAVDSGSARFAVFDGMGDGLHSAQLTALTVAAYRNARRGTMSLTDTAHAVEMAVGTAHPGSFVTAVIAHLDTDTGLLSWINVGHPRRCCCAAAGRSSHCRTGQRCPSGSAARSGTRSPSTSRPNSSNQATACCLHRRRHRHPLPGRRVLRCRPAARPARREPGCRPAHPGNHAAARALPPRAPARPTERRRHHAPGRVAQRQRASHPAVLAVVDPQLRRRPRIPGSIGLAVIRAGTPNVMANG
jgi:Stage II sporulation protein E (SpoIIE)